MATHDQRYWLIVHMQLEDMGPVCWPAILGLADKQMAFVRLLSLRTPLVLMQTSPVSRSPRKRLATVPAVAAWQAFAMASDFAVRFSSR